MVNRTKPTIVKLISGTQRKSRFNPNEPEFARGMPKPPSDLPKFAREEWNRVVPEIFAAGVLTNPDRSVLIAYVLAFDRWRRAEKVFARMAREDPVHLGMLITNRFGALTGNPAVAVAEMAAKECIRFAVELGMTPSARSKVRAITAEGEAAVDPAAKFLQAREKALYPRPA
jgi:P27 family predicted phage terminase small subunit